MKWYDNLKGSLRRWHRIKRVTRAVQAYSRQLFPDTIPDWNLIAEEHPHEWVVYQTYRRADARTAVLLHRFFRVNLDDFTVTSLGEGYRPQKWDLFL